MQAIVYEGPNKLAVKDIPKPELKEGAVIVRLGVLGDGDPHPLPALPAHDTHVGLPLVVLHPQLLFPVVVHGDPSPMLS